MVENHEKDEFSRQNLIRKHETWEDFVKDSRKPRKYSFDCRDVLNSTNGDVMFLEINKKWNKVAIRAESSWRSIFKRTTSYILKVPYDIKELGNTHPVVHSTSYKQNRIDNLVNKESIEVDEKYDLRTVKQTFAVLQGNSLGKTVSEDSEVEDKMINKTSTEKSTQEPKGDHHVIVDVPEEDKRNVSIEISDFDEKNKSLGKMAIDLTKLAKSNYSSEWKILRSALIQWFLQLFEPASNQDKTIKVQMKAAKLHAAMHAGNH